MKRSTNNNNSLEISLRKQVKNELLDAHTDTTKEKIFGLSTSPLGRRSFLQKIGTGIAGTIGAGVAFSHGIIQEIAAEDNSIRDRSPKNPFQDKDESRLATLKRLRVRAIERSLRKNPPLQKNNGEEKDYPYIATFTKGLQHDKDGKVLKSAYTEYIEYLQNGSFKKFGEVKLGGERKFVNPFAGICYDLIGSDPTQFAHPPAPRFDSMEGTAEVIELYLISLLRDVPFTDFTGNVDAVNGCRELSQIAECKAPRLNGAVVPETVFKDEFTGKLLGPYISQFLYKDIPYAQKAIKQTYPMYTPGKDYLVNYDEWLSIQNGKLPKEKVVKESIERYILTPRDLATFVHLDFTYQTFLNATLILLGMKTPLSEGNPYKASQTMDGFATFGAPNILTLIAEVATRALKAEWYQKWFVHRRARPEEIGGVLYQYYKNGIDAPLLKSLKSTGVISESVERVGNALLPQAYPEASPLHPAYGSGHAVISGACITLLKAWFDGNFIIPEAVQPSADGLSLSPYNASQLTVEAELDKLGSNIGIGRCFAGIHWRSDSVEGMKLGEEVALSMLREYSVCTREPHQFRFKKLNGSEIRFGRKNLL
jgi:hypothetical protein